MTDPAIVVGVADPRDADVAAALDALTVELTSSGYTPEQTFGYSADDLVARGVHLLAARVGGELVGTGGIEVQDDGVAELKRFWTRPDRRGTGVADAVVAALLDHARTCGTRLVRLETGDRQAAAIRFYTRHGFEVVPRFAPYEDSETSVCLQRRL